MTAAHKKHPAGTRLRVTRTDVNKSVVVTVNDEGPFTVGHIIDLSKAAADALDMLALGVANVKVEVIGRDVLTPPGSRTASTNPSTSRSTQETTRKTAEDQSVRSYDNPPGGNSSSNSSSNANNQTQKTATTNNIATKVDRIPTITAESDEPATVEVTAKTPIQGELEGKGYSKYGLHKIEISQPTPGYGVQVMALNTYESVFPQIANYQSKGFKDVYVTIDPSNATYPYKIILGMYEEEAAAKRYGNDLRAKYGVKGFVTGNEYTGYFYKINLLKPDLQGYGVQVMSLSSYENALEQLISYKSRGFKNIYFNVEKGQGRSNYKIILGMFDNQDSANRYKNDLNRKYKVKGFVSSFIQP